MDGEAAGEEIEIERIPTRVIQSRSKHLVPVVDYLQTPKIRQTRTSALDDKITEKLLHQSTGISENSRISATSILGSLAFMIGSGGAVAEFDNGIQGAERDDHLVPAKTKSFVNSSINPKPNHGFLNVNNRREHLSREGQLMFVNSDREGLQMENHIED